MKMQEMGKSEGKTESKNESNGNNKLAFSWKFSKEKFSRLEIVLLLASSLVFFLLLWIYFPWLIALTLTLFFIIAHYLLSHGIKAAKKGEIHYQAEGKHLAVNKIIRETVVRERILLHKAEDCRFDRFFLRGFLVSQGGKKHRLYFNSKDEMRGFRKHLQQHMKPKKGKKRGKRKSLQEQIKEAKRGLRNA